NYTKADYLKVIEQFESDKKFENLKGYLKKLWDYGDGSLLSDERYQYIRSKILYRILEKKREKGKGVFVRLLHSLNRIAAFLLIPLFLASAYFFFQWRDVVDGREGYAEIHCPPGARTKFNLPDGTIGWLNSNSFLKYPVQFMHNRQVDLTGEAYFDVKENKCSPFTVNAGEINVQVLGTHFNVMAYPDDERVEVTLEEGSVKVIRTGTNRLAWLKPDQRFIFYRNKNKESVVTGNPRYFTSWKEGFLVFRNVPFSEVASRLGRWYNSEIIIQDERLNDLPYRATFKDEPLERVLSLLSMSAPINYRIIDSKTGKDGIYEKQKVIISYKY
ncbi:MAG: FecR family protein, partial [Mangrovibacterium sp.]